LYPERAATARRQPNPRTRCPPERPRRGLDRAPASRPGCSARGGARACEARVASASVLKKTVPPTIRARAPSFDPEHFWQAAPGREPWEAMVRKYAALARLARLPEDQRKLALRQTARRWPGSLREGELIGPVQVAAREAAAKAGLAEPERARATWIDEPAQAVLCWASLHLLID